MDRHTEFENRYMSKFEALLAGVSGVIIKYQHDRAGIDTGLHLFVEGRKATKAGEAQPYWRPVPGRVWFQVKGKHAATAPADEVVKAHHIAVEVEVDHLKFWYASPEPIYLVAYAESTDEFFGIDVRDLVEQRWGGTFYTSMRDNYGHIVVHVPTANVMDAERIAKLANHRSMRIDGPAFRGRPLGHRMDPLRCVLATPSPRIWTELVAALLEAHDFRETSRAQHGDVTILHGTLFQSLMWQSPAFSEHGYSEPDAIRDEPPLEQIFGDVRVVIDPAEGRRNFQSVESRGLNEFDRDAAKSGYQTLAFFRDLDLSGGGGIWRRTWTPPVSANQGCHQVGLEAMSYLVLTATLVYLEFAPHLDWDEVNFLS